MKKESQFSKQFRDDLYLFCKKFICESHVQLIVDSPRSGKKPYDAYALIRGKFFAFEFKRMGTSIRKDAVVPHQISKLDEVWHSGGNSYIIVFNLDNEALVFDTAYWNDLCKTSGIGRASIVAEDVRNNCNEIITREKVDGITMYNFKWFLNDFRV